MGFHCLLRYLALTLKQMPGSKITNDQRFQMLVEKTRVIAWEADMTSWQFTYVSPQAETILGYPLKDWYQKDFWTQKIHPDDREATIDYCLKSSRERESYDFQYRMIAADGRVLWLEDIVSVIKKEDGTKVLAGYMIDITERRDALDQLNASRESLDQALDAGKMGIWDWNVAENKLVWSTQMQRLFGLEPGTFRGTYEHYQELLHPEDREQVIKTVNEAIEKREPYMVEHRVQQADGSFRWMMGKGRAFYDDSGKLVRMSGVTTDITEKRLAELEYRQIFNIPTNLICIFGADGNFHKINPAFQAIMGWEPAHLLGKPISEFIHPDDVALTLGEVAKLFSGTPMITDLRIRGQNRDGTYRWVSWSGTSVHGKVYAIGTDISARIHAEEALSEAVRVRDEFISLASHELKTPLTSIQLQTQIAEREISQGNTAYFTAEKSKKFLSVLRLQIERLTNLIEDMLDVSRISLKSLRVDKTRFELGSLVEEVLEKLQSQLQSQGGEVRFHAEGKVEGCWDRFRIEQVLVNLLTNARKYGEGKPVRIELAKRGGEAVLSVADQGVGIAKEHQKKIFERFERVTQDRGISGLGLGLYITRHIVQNHQGRIEVESEPGRGSKFTVFLPLG